VRYVTLERSSIELTLAQYAENAAQLAIACELLQQPMPNCSALA